MTSERDGDGTASAIAESADSTKPSAQFSYLRHESIITAFAAAARLGTAPAIVCGGEIVSYETLDRRSNQLAHALIAQGVCSGDRIALLLDRSSDAICIILATLKAGAAYMPLDPTYPASYLEPVLAQAAPRLIIVHDGAIPPSAAAKVLSVTALRDLSLNYPDDGLATAIGAGDAAYIMHTSGSSGSPKGVVAPHRAVVRLVRDQTYLRFAPDEIFLSASPLAFDASTLEIWGALLNGACVVVLPDPRPSLDAIADTIARHRVTTAWFTAGLFNLLVDHRPEALDPLRQILAGGDVLSPSHVAKAIARLPGRRIVNGYGPTENTTFTCCRQITAADAGAGAIPIGAAIAHTDVFILDEEMRSAPAGAAGQLAAAGDGLALGYLDRPDLTAEKFVSLALGGDAPIRVYLTGDLVKRREDGAIEFLGRIDSQIKIDGKRIELGEIEHRLREDPRVRDAAVIARNVGNSKHLFAYFVPMSADASSAEILSALRCKLPSHMCPASLTPLPSFPLTPNGKVDRAGLASQGDRVERPFRRAEATDLESILSEIWADVLGASVVDPSKNFFDLGGTSLQLVEAHARTQARLGRTISIVSLFEHPTVASLALHLRGDDREPGPLATSRKAALPSQPDGYEPIAIIGIAGRFPGASGVDQFWRNICGGVDSITHFAEGELEDAFDDTVRGSEEYVPARPVLPDVDLMDAAFFGIYPREAALMDPQHRVFLECAWEAVENAGYAPGPHLGPVGVFAGCSMNTYFLHHLCADRDAIEAFTSGYQVGDYPTLIGSLSDTLATRVSYKLDLRGPSATVQSACSTSLLAVAQACQSLRSGQSSMALAGGVSITFPQRRGYLHQPGGIVSADGRCRPFDADASGTVFGSGAGAVLLKPLSAALRDGDHIYATIRGCGVTNDGAQKVGFTAPSSDGQAAAISAALGEADIDARTIGYVECHGTATPLGDPVELAGLAKAFGASTGERAACALGSVKANVGHLDAAAGVVGLIKAALALKHATIPPLANFARPNARMELDRTPFYFPTKVAPWAATVGPRRAGVSSFGVGGTNVHVVLEEAAVVERQSGEASQTHVLPLSARSEAALKSMTRAVAEAIAASPQLPLSDVAYTLQHGRTTFPFRDAVACASSEDAVAKLRGIASAAPRSHPKAGRLVFMFPGQGAQYAGMGRGFYRDNRAFRADVDYGAETLAPLLGLDIRDLVLAAAGDTSRLRLTQYTQPALFVLEHALGRFWMRLGLRPDALVGHSMGEIVAACLAGVFSFEDGCRLVARRAALMQAQPEGAMLAVRLSEADTRARMGPDLDLAAVNAPTLCVVAGAFSAIESFEADLARQDVAHTRLETSHAFHSRAMDPVVGALEDVSSSIAFSPPVIPIASCVTGQWATASELASPAYWAGHCRKPVRFHEALRTAAAGESPFLLEVGPGSTLSAIAAQAINRRTLAGLASTLPGPDSAKTDSAQLAAAAAKLWRAGVSMEWEHLREGGGRRVALPTYPFERSRHWIEAPPARRTSARAQPDTQSNSFPPDPSLQRLDAPMPPSAPDDRTAALRAQIADIIESLAGAKVEPGDYGAPFLDLGFNSLFLGQVARALERQFKIKLTFRQLLNDFPSLDGVADHIAATSAVPATAIVSTPTSASPAATSQASSLAALQSQVEAISRQLQLLQGRPAEAPSAPATRAPADPSVVTETFARFRPYQTTSTVEITTEAQKAFVVDLVKRTNARTPGAKAQTQQNRTALADPRTAAGFRPEWKELVYPVVARRSEGSKIWDIDGNVYVDLVNGYGQTMFGHAPSFVTDAIAEQLKEGFAIGPQSPLAGEVAQMLVAMVGMERATFCNTGSEAVMAAMRVARAVTGRGRVVVFANDYHGQFDEVLVKPGRGGSGPRALPIAPGIPPETMANMVVLQYGAQESLDWIASNAEGVAAVIVEPVQSRHPELRPLEFVKSLREITARNDVALIFDEIVTGFRVHPGGMQAVYGVRADMATYGKVVGGGMPVGVLAGAARFMDALDGGSWRFGDDSAPEVAPTFFAGTFVRHPLVLAACKAVLAYLKAEGPALQERVASRTAGLAGRLNAALASRGFSTRIETYSSWFMVNLGAEHRLGSLFYPLMRSLGVHIQDGYPCFLTTAHTDADVALIERAFNQALDELKQAGIIASGSPSVAVQAPAATIAAPDEAPLTEPQIEILLAAQLTPEASCAFNEGVSLELKGPLDLAALQAALGDVVARHDALRARIDRGGEKMLIRATLKLDAPLVDFSGAADPDAAYAGAMAHDAALPFDLYAGPLVRAQVLRLAPARHVLMLTAHHIVADGWAINVLIQDLAACYNARKAGAAPRLATAPSFAAYAIEERKRGVDAGAERFWLDLYKDPVPVLEMPYDRPRPALKSFAGATFSAEIDAKLTAAVKKMGAKLGCTLYATLLAAMQVLVARLANESDVVVGAPAAGQSLLEEEQNLVGHCVSFLPVRCALDMAQGFDTHLACLKRRLLDVFEHQNYTFGTLVRRLGAPRTPNRTPLTDVQFNLERIGEGAAFDGLAFSFRPNPKSAGNFDLFFNMIESGRGLRVDVDYSTDLYDAATIGRFVGNLRTLLTAIAANPATPVRDLPILTAEERAWLKERGAAQPNGPLEANVVEAFAAQARRHGLRPALLSSRPAQSYADLDARSNQIARALAARGLGAGDRVAILAHRSPDTIAVILAVLKRGAIYVPLDPSYPADQIAYMARDCGARLTLADETAAAAFHGALPQAPTPLSAVFAEAQALPAGPASPPRTKGDDPAYIMYTSGSTGRPKGVVVPHRAILRLVRGQTFAQLDADQVFLHLAPLAFDASTLEIWGALLNGGALAIVEENKPSLDQIAASIATHKATIAWFTAALFHAIVAERAGALAPLRQILAGGDVLSPDLVAKAQAAAPRARIVNGYGPTENTTFTCCYPFPVGGWGGGAAPIGFPIAGASVYVCDAQGDLAPRGAIGELYTGGLGVALGYHERDDLTRERFVAARFPEAAGATLYRTGDLVRWRADGAIDFLGRADQQVKINGFRVELGEIERALDEARGVAEAVAVVRSGEDGAKQLFAFVTLDPGAAPQAVMANARAHVELRLPAHMRPRNILAVPAIPRTANGKADRAALLAHAEFAPTPVLPAGAAAPPTPTQARIAEAWAAVLGMATVPVDEPIFALGADSLQVFRIAARLSQSGLDVDARQLMRNPTVRELAARVDGAPPPESGSSPTAPALSQFRRGATRKKETSS